LIKEQGKEYMLGEVYEQCLQSEEEEIPVNYVKQLYDQFSYTDISEKISEIVKPAGMKAEVQVVFQSIENLHKAIPNHSGDWYFSGNFPTVGGQRVANRAFVNYMEGKLVRAY